MKRVLHVVGGMDRGGVETWLMHVLRALDPARIRMDFLVQTGRRCEYDDEIEARGCRVLRCTQTRHSPEYAKAVSECLRSGGPYHAIHSHVHHFSGYLLGLARLAGVPARIAHSHSDTSREDEKAGTLRRQYLWLTKRWIRWGATHFIAASDAAGRALFGDLWKRDPRHKLLHCGIDLEPFETAPSRLEARAALGIRPDEFVIGHTGRFAAPKNHMFLAEVAAELANRRPRMRLLLIGDGPGRPAVAERVRQLGIQDRTIFAGVRTDVPRLLAGIDVFVFPSLWEGLPLSVLEAQAAGLPCLLSDGISPETDVVPGSVKRLPLSAGPGSWAEEILRLCPRIDPREALEIVKNSSFNVARSVEELYALYNA